MDTCLYSNMIWSVVATANTHDVVEYLKKNLKSIQSVKKLENIDSLKPMWRSDCLLVARCGDSVYIGGWGLPYGNIQWLGKINTLEKNVDSVLSLINGLSAEFGEASVFGSDHGGINYFWARSEQGKTIRKYAAYIDEFGEHEKPDVSAGEPTEIEIELSKTYLMPSINGATGTEFLDDNAVKQVAASWSIDPDTLGEQFTEAYLIELGTHTLRIDPDDASVDGRYYFRVQDFNPERSQDISNAILKFFNQDTDLGVQTGLVCTKVMMKEKETYLVMFSRSNETNARVKFFTELWKAKIEEANQGPCFTGCSFDAED
ncbi:MAG: hypothetical protein H6999_01255 [Hahellaceae bacterium]|nr:hypothetical protein [Hahellaceae bacterium]MCP5168379.1 hypothetical protein [Hahellaceae bacterium]